MVDYNELMGWLSIPRPNGSQAECKTRQALQGWLERHSIPYRLHAFRLYPNFFVAIGIWLIVSRTLLALAIWMRWGWPAAVISILSLLGGTVDVALGFPLVGWPGATRGENIIIEFEPSTPQQEIVFSAHYDTKSEFLDHRQRMFFIKNLPAGILLTVMLGLLAPLDHALLAANSAWSSVSFAAGILFSLPLLGLAWGLGLNLSMGHFSPPSQGAVDNGAACAILLGLADRVHKGELALDRTCLTLAIFTGEEVNMQGSRAYATGRDWPLPTLAINLEVMAQDGSYVYWEQDGTSLKLVPTSPKVNHILAETVAEVTGAKAIPAGPVNSDGYSFIRAGIPATTLGTYDKKWVDRGFHSPADNLERVVMARLPEAVEILARLATKYDSSQLQMTNL